ncbi:MAG: BtpA/SgcQ family protein [Candidatus Heimdallarchaeota archaeon]|nr:BtpA/SgcQ family protein [Candidatus Heimdallarchaeota archaeon]MBY8993081.1 BtpA/SgcQ family protein [Candidatus Heimdallarchaeota archaeon]
MTETHFKLNQLEKLFGVKKPVIGMIHLKALPGAPKSSLSVSEVLALAVDDLNSLIEGKVDGVLVENYNDYPFHPFTVEPSTIVSMSLIVKELVKSSSVPVGVNVLRNACSDALVIASFTGAEFIRCNFLTGAYVTDQGVIVGCAHILKRLQKQLSCIKTETNPLIFGDVLCKHASPISPRTLELEAIDALERGLADAVIITGNRTGLPAKLSDLKLLRKKQIQPILVGSGVTSDSIQEILPYIDGVIIGTSLKHKNKISLPVDRKKVEEFMQKVHEFRD